MAINSEGDSQSFAYTGGMQSFTVPQKGIYKLEVWGAQGGSGTKTGGKGGYSYGHVLLEKGAVLYVCCGQAGESSTSETYNGGGGGKSKYFGFTEHYHPTATGSSGGGATHIATRSGTLAALGSTSGLLIVAGGGGGSGSGCNGGDGGGDSGGSATWGGYTNKGGTQTSGYQFGQGQTASAAWGDWDGVVNYDCAAGSGGGGGLYGGYASVNSGAENVAKTAGGGGSGYTGGVPELTYFGTAYKSGMSSGQRSGSGYAVITFVKKGELPVVVNGTTLQKILVNGVEVAGLVVNGMRVFLRRMKGRLRAWPWRMRRAAPA